MNEIVVGLNAWIIQDGNYAEFIRGESRKLALEFNGSALTPSDKREMQCQHKDTSRYEVVAKVIFSTPEVWVIDFGIKVYCESRPPRFATVGQWVQGEVWIGVDPFFYKDRLHRMPGMPDLFVDWVVTKIQLETTPWIEDSSAGRTMMMRDSGREAWTEKAMTNAWNDDSGRADYLLSLST
ncbi:hypothetical protein [Burkholderia territorii]|uniref:hypothetical protein n=1 Tax=Burkholderia territorii TaxID=1503055 RepID=UPI0007565784|nr:hypothetical protein [Burkholderia territorii]KWO61104.1 hypothetical protein WT98_30680 [Burkholderia territorii]